MIAPPTTNLIGCEREAEVTPFTGTLDSPLIEDALQAHHAGLCVVPPTQDGTKRPMSDWKHFQTERPSLEQIEAWYNEPDRTGIGYVCGHISGGLEAFEFDDEGAFHAFERLVNVHDLSELWRRHKTGYFESTPSGGFHVLWYTEAGEGNQPLARRPYEDTEGLSKVAVLIETRGQGGYIIAAPSGGGVHPTGGSYQLISGGPRSIQTITADERDTFFALARMLDEMPSKSKEPPAARRGSGDRPGDRFSRETSWEELLPGYGWTVEKQIDVETYWTRPGKIEGVSATTNYNDSGLLKVFTSSTSLEAGATYSPFAFYTHMEHGGDFSAAARTLAAKYREQDGTIATPVNAKKAVGNGYRPRLINMASVQSEEIDWLWPKWIARGEFHIIGGQGGVGKGTITANLAAIGSQDDRVWPDGMPAPRFNSLFLSAEDSPERTIKPRLDLHDADPRAVSILPYVEDAEGQEFLFNVNKHLPALEAAIIECGAELIVIDPLSTIMAGSDRNQEGDVRDMLTPLVKLAARHNVAIIGVMHVGKPNGSHRTATQSLLGSSGFGNLARVVMMTAESEEGERVFGVTKTNLAKIMPTLRWDRQEDKPIEWLGLASHNVETILGGSRTGGLKPIELAEQFLREILADGPKPSAEVIETAKAQGIGKSTLDRAKGKIGATSVKSKAKHGTWDWVLARSAPAYPGTTSPVWTSSAKPLSPQPLTITALEDRQTRTSSVDDLFAVDEAKEAFMALPPV